MVLEHGIMVMDAISGGTRPTQSSRPDFWDEMVGGSLNGEAWMSVAVVAVSASTSVSCIGR